MDTHNVKEYLVFLRKALYWIFISFLFTKSSICIIHLCITPKWNALTIYQGSFRKNAISSVPCPPKILLSVEILGIQKWIPGGIYSSYEYYVSWPQSRAVTGTKQRQLIREKSIVVVEEVMLQIAFQMWQLEMRWTTTPKKDGWSLGSIMGF